MCLGGLFTAFTFIPTYMEILEASQINLNTKHPRLYDITSGVLTFGVGLGMLIGP